MTVVETSKAVRPGEAGYEAGVRGWELDFEQRPAAVFAATSAADLVEAVRYARAHGLPLSVINTGHGPVRANDSGVVINVSALNGVQVDPVARTARAEGGAVWGQVQAAAAEFGLAGLAGDDPTVGVAGFTLGGGMGWFGRKYGIAADSLLEVEIVTADGNLRKVNAANDPEFFWALRGGGAGFGVVAALTFRLYPAARVLAGQVFFPLERAADMLRFYRQWAASLPDDVTSTAGFLRGPDLPQMAPFLRGRTAFFVRFVHSGDLAAGYGIIAPLRAQAGLLAEQVLELTPPELGPLLGPPPGPMFAYGRGEQFDALSDGAIEALVAYASRPDAVPSIIELRHMGGAIARQCYDSSAYSQRDAVFLLNARTMSPVEAFRAAAKAYADGIGEAVRPFVTGRVAPNFITGDEGVERDHAAYAGGNYARLAAVKARVDPSGFFRFGRTPGTR